MKKILVIAMLIFAFGCSDNGTAPIQERIVGKWMKKVPANNGSGNDVLVMEFTKDRKYYATGNTGDDDNGTLVGSYNFDNDIIILKDSDCENVEGRYGLVFRDNGVEFLLKGDDCDRADFITGFFDKYKATLYD